jgi:hypothetical protein
MLYVSHAGVELANSRVRCRVHYSEAEFLDESQTKVFLLATQSHLYSLALRCLFLQTNATSYSFFSVLLYTVKEKGEKHNRKPHSLPYMV